jgi:sulfur-oxidizing protein SoxY
MQRRQALAAAAGLLALGDALAQAARTGFDTQGLAETLRALGLATPQPSRDLELSAPDIAENGAVVRVELSSKLPGVKRFWLLAEKNPNSLVASLALSDAVEPRLVTNMKLAQSSLVYGVAQMADGKLLMAQKDVKVTLGGCAA